MKKRSLSFLLALLMLVSCLPVSALAARHETRDIDIWVNGFYIKSDVNPFEQNGRTYVPLRFVAEELGYAVEWDAVNWQVIVSKGSDELIFTIDSNEVLVNGVKKYIDAPALLRDERTFVPLRHVAELLGENVDYDAANNVAIVGYDYNANNDYYVKYYYKNYDPVITVYTINIVNLSYSYNGNVIKYKNKQALYEKVEMSVTNYFKTGSSSEVTVFTKNKDYYSGQVGKKTSNTKDLEEIIGIYGNDNVKVIDYNDYVKAIEGKAKQLQSEVKSNVSRDKQLRDQYYVDQSSRDPLVGTWYGPSGYDLDGRSYDTDKYLYITALGNNRYKIESRTILAGDSSSQGFVIQYGSFDPSSGILYVEYSDNSYNTTGLFAREGLVSNEGWYQLNNNGTRLVWKDGGQYYMDKY